MDSILSRKEKDERLSYLKDVGPVQEKEYRSGHDHLAAVGAPALVHPLHEHKFVHRFAQELLGGFKSRH